MWSRAARSSCTRLRAQRIRSQECAALRGAQQLRGLATASATEDAPAPWKLWRVALGLGLAGAAGYTGFQYAYSTPSKAHLTTLSADEAPHDIGTFTLTDDRGKTVTDQTHGFKKEFAVLLFGSLDHPDFHMWMEKFAKALHESDDKCNQEHLKPIVLCLDPEKDTPERCKEAKAGLKSNHLWKESFHRRVAIVTGPDVAKIHEVAHTFTRKFFGKHPQNTGTPCATDLGWLYMVSPEGKLLEAYGLNDDTPEAISTDWAEVQRRWNLHHPSWHGCRNVAKRYA